MKRQTDPDVLLLQAAADPTRLAILRQLSDAPEVCACDFTACCDVSQPTVSHHLKVLRDAGWIAGERRGTWVWYSLRPEAVARFRELAGGVRAAVGMPSLTGRVGSRSCSPSRDGLDLRATRRFTLSAMKIAELAQRAGVAASAVRWYERRASCLRPARRANGYRDYADVDLARLRLVLVPATARAGTGGRWTARPTVPRTRIRRPRPGAAPRRPATHRSPANGRTSIDSTRELNDLESTIAAAGRATRRETHDDRRSDQRPVRLHAQLRPQPDRRGAARPLRRGRVSRSTPPARRSRASTRTPSVCSPSPASTGRPAAASRSPSSSTASSTTSSPSATEPGPPVPVFPGSSNTPALGPRRPVGGRGHRRGEAGRVSSDADRDRRPAPPVHRGGAPRRGSTVTASRA